MTAKLSLDDPYRREFGAEVLESADGWCALSQTVFYPGGGGQPHDRGRLILRGGAVAVSAVREDDDFKLADFARERLVEFEGEVNAAIDRALPISSSTISEEEYRHRPELVRTLNVLPPVVDGRVRIVTIAGFDTQACGGTHVHSTGEIGRVRIVKFDNKGKENKRFYWAMHETV